MKNVCVAIILACLSGNVFAEDVVVPKDSRPEIKESNHSQNIKTEETIDKNGTKSKSTISTKADTDSDGSSHSSMDIKSSTDPKGLGNKTWKERHSAASNNGKGSYQNEVDRSSVDSAGTKRNHEDEETVTKNHDGSTETVVKERVVNDPKGLNNRATKKLDETVKVDSHGRVVKDDISEEVDGK